MSGRLAGKIAIVTGGTSGIGESTVRLFVSEGARVVVVARRPGPGEQLVADLGPDTTRFVSGDVATERTAKTAVDLAEVWGGLDILVNNAAMDWVSPILETSEADVRRVLDANFIGSFLMQREAARRMLGLTSTPLVRTWIDDQNDPVAFEKEVTATIPQGRMAQPIEVANAILFLASDESRHITGITLAVDGGYTAA